MSEQDIEKIAEIIADVTITKNKGIVSSRLIAQALVAAGLHFKEKLTLISDEEIGKAYWEGMNDIREHKSHALEHIAQAQLSHDKQ
jgi:hypothetical protein